MESSTIFNRNNRRPDIDIAKAAEFLAFAPVIIAGLLFFGMGIENASQSELVPDAAGSNISNATTNITAGETQVLVHSNAKVQREELSQDELKTKGVAVKLKLNKRGNGQIKLEDHGKKNPVAVAPPGKSVKFVDISAEDNDFESAEVRIQYSDEELGGVDENRLVVYHWNGAAWDVLATVVDAGNNLLIATTSSLSPFAISEGAAIGSGGKILVATNRFVILDDPTTGTPDTSSGFSNMASGDSWGTTTWIGKTTTINATALYIDENGHPVSGKYINFSLRRWDGVQVATAIDRTNQYGLANFSFDLDDNKYYGKWRVQAANGSISSNTSFIYNWWGCAVSSVCNGHSSKSLTSGAVANSPYLNGNDRTTYRDNNHYASSTKCTFCHQSFDGLPGDDVAAQYSMNTSDVHRNVTSGCANASCHGDYYVHGRSSGTGNMLIGSCYNTTGGCHTSRADISNKSTLNSSNVNTALSLYSYNNASSFNATFHTPNSTVPCIICHGPMHNITKPDDTQRFINNTNTEDSQCKTCHTSYSEHNSSNISSGGVNCTLCHSDDVHYIQVFAQNSTGGATYVNTTNASIGNCTLCHQNGTFFASLKNASKAGSYTGRNPPQVAVPLEHSNDPAAGGKWEQTYWTNSDQLTWCKYCHGETNHKAVALGRPSLWDGTNSVNSSLSPGSTTWCASCHWQGYVSGSNTSSDMTSTFTGDGKLVPPEISGNTTNGANTSIYEYTNHSRYTSYSSILNDSTCDRCHGYNYPFTTITQLMHNQSSVGGPDCVGCHDIGGIVLLSKIDVTATNDANAIHKNLNSNAPATVDSNNRRCWACHGNGSEPPPNAHPSNYKIPYNCTNCHVQGAGQNFNYNPTNTLLNVSQHFWNGTSIKTTAVSTCYACHNKSEMMIAANDPDAGTGAVYSGANGGNNSSSHYGKKRTDLHTWNGTQAVNCSYCHQNASTAFNTAMLDPGYNSSIQNHSALVSSPSCFNSSCHNSGWIHNSTLTKPVLTLPNSSYCTDSCHGTGGSATFNNRSKHNNSVNCTQCHLNSSRSIHPVRYLQNINNTWNTTNTSAVNCTNCHQNSTFWNNSPSAPIIPAILKHSSNTSNGSIWNGSATPFWTSNNGSCYYCHGNTKHNTTALGTINSLLTDTNNTRNGTLSSTKWCADCHLNTSNSNYSGSIFSPVPPLITINNTNKSNWLNHSSYFGSGYKDSACRACHAMNNSSYAATSLNYSHSLDEGISGGPDCVSCHDIGGFVPALVNVTTLNASDSIHKNLNSNASATVDSNNKRCWACHGNGTQPSSGNHPSNYTTPYTCENCHVISSTQNFNYTPNNTLINVSEHFWNGNELKTYSITTCYRCHNISEMMLQASDPDNGSGAVYSGMNGGDLSVSHYGKKRNDLSSQQNNSGYCGYCHQNTSTMFPVSNTSMSNHSSTSSTPGCNAANCHEGGRIHNSSLNKTMNCIICHTQAMNELQLGYNNNSAPTGQNMTLPRDTKITDWLGSDPPDPPGNNIMYSRHANPNSSGGYTGAEGSARNPNQICINCHTNIVRANGDWRNNNWNNNQVCKPCHYLYKDDNLYSGEVLDQVPNAHNLSMPRCTDCHALLAPATSSHLYNSPDAPKDYGKAPNIGEDLNSSKHYRMVLNTSSSHPTEEKGCLVCHTNVTYTINYSVDPINITISNYNGSHEWNSKPYCTGCHPISGGGVGPNSTNHSIYNIQDGDNSRCFDCHSQAARYGHSIQAGGGPNCISCHDTGGYAQHRINNSAMNGTDAVHRNLNSNAVNSSFVSAENKKCWGCHDSTGTQPSNDSMGSRYTNPYKCYDCHNSTSKPYSNVSTAPNVSEHFKGGDQIRAASSSSDNSSSCVVCHNLSELKVSYTEDDSYNTNKSISSHYARNRTDLRTWNGIQSVNCSYCHQNISTAFNTAMLDPGYNSSIQNHSTLSSSPSCFNSSCHNSGWIHNSTLTKPVLTLPNSSFCISCHSTKEQHNGSTGLNCTQCHLNTSKSIHPVRYLQQDGSNWSTTNSGAVNCTSCHQGTGLTNFSTAPKIPTPMNHSINTYSGAMWNGTQSRFWDNTSQQSSCNYCHGTIAYHNSSGLGNITLIKGNNTVRQSLTGGYWCANCHYNGSASSVNYSYNGNLFDPVPPEILNLTGSVPAVSRDGTGFVNHSGYFSSGFDDEICKDCHNNNLAAGATSLNLSHNVGTGISGNPNCIQCHNLATGLSGGAPSGINFTSANISVHNGTNSNNATSQGYAPVVGSCWACHSSNGSVTSGHPDRYKTPKTCTECHLGSGTYNTSSYNAIIVSQHYYGGTNITTGNSSSNIISCITCHENVSEMILYNNDTDYGTSFSGDGIRLVGGNLSYYHYGKNRSDIRTWNSGNTVNCSYCHQNASTAFNTAMLDPGYNSSIQNHSTGSSSPDCFNSTCHNSGWIHNSTLTRPSFTSANSTYCQDCHSKEKHNNTLNCNRCHINSSSSDTIHPIKYLQANSSFQTSNTTAVNCTNCHQNSSFWTGSPSAPIIPTTLKHSSNTSNGSIWNSPAYWTSNNGSCYYCHGNTKHNTTALGTINSLLTDINNTRNGTLSDTKWCADCHLNTTLNNNYSGTLWNPVPPLITINNTGKSNWVNHSNYFGSSYKDSICRSCHELNGSSIYAPTSLNYSHSLDEGVTGGRNCVSCHDISGSTPRVDVSKINTSIHMNLNINGTATLSPDNKPCWACHTNVTLFNNNIINESDLPSTGHPESYSTPKRCTQCHTLGNFSATIVSEHNSAGTEIKTKPHTDTNESCISCHNKSEMLLSNSDPGGPKSEFANVSHYGSNKTGSSIYITAGSANCTYCHQNTSTVFDTEMVDPTWNRSIQNHTALGTNPGCNNTTCHNTGRIHDSTLTKPALSTTLCTICHPSKQKHNNSIECISCHLETNKSIHPVQYLQIDNIWKINSAANKTSAVNCTSCHQNSMTGFSTAPKIPTPMNHSTNTYSGAMWNGTQSGFWDNISQQSSCNYCHGTIAYHNSSGLGNITLTKGNNTVRQSLTGGYWCANCHYNGGTSSGKFNYKGNLFNPVPPEILNLTGSVPAVSRDGTSFVNHSSYFSSGFDDNACKNCHNNNLNSGATSLNFSHNVGTGVAGGANCTACHDVGGSAGAGRLINSTAMNNSIHSNLNSDAFSSSGYPSSNFKCWACHGNGSEPGADHPSNYKNPYNCTSCHIQGAEQNLNFTPLSIMNVSQHYWNGTSITTAAATSCYVCHNLSEMMLGSFDPDGTGSVYAGTNGGNNSTSHYGKKRTDYPIQGTNDYCNSCHNNSSTVFPFIDPNNKSISNHSVNSAATPLCANSTCHSSGRIHNSTLNKPVFSIPNSSYCANTGCHPTRAKHNGTVECTLCHLNASRNIHAAGYLQNDGSSWSTFSSTAVNCTTCHQRSLSNFSTAKQVPELEHSSDPYSGMKWGNYWNNNSAITACYYCHQSQVHLATGLLGNITSIRGSNTYNNADIANSTWCVNCHYSSASQYNGTILDPVPPEITNSSLNSTDGTAFYNHSNFAGYNDSICKNCHGAALSGYPETTLNFSHAVSEGGGGPNCISCHDESGTGAPSDKRISFTSMTSAVHKNLNSDAVNSTAVDPRNKACWACHGDGTEPSGHPLNYTNPRRCSNNDCHSLAQSYKAPMVYSHFKDAELNDNGNRVLNYNVTTVDSCETCHSNSLSAESDNINASVSHYATKDGLIDSINCLYCHLDKDNAQTWGNAIEVNKNRTDLIEMNRDIHEMNKFTAHEGAFVELGLGYRLKVTGVSKLRGSAAIELYHYDTLVDKGLVNAGQYTYEETVTIDNDVFTTPIIILNVSEMFLAENDTFIQFDGWRIKRLHPENKTTSCYLCHYVVGNDRHKYSVIDKVNDRIYFADILFNSSDIQEYDEQQALKILSNITSRDSFTDIERSGRKSMYEGETWDIGKDLRLTLKDISTNSDSALFLLEIGNKTYQDVVGRDGVLEYEISVSYPGQKQNNITIFRAKVPEILQNKPNMVVLTEILALSPEIRSVRDNTSIYGYNASWLWENDTFLTGRIPASMHAPLLHDGIDGGPNCVSCHTGIELGSHNIVNEDSISSVAKENKACWACHGDGKEPLRHPISYKYPRNCKSCHVEMDNTFNATHIGDEKHSTLDNCVQCHVENTHKVFRFDVVPGIKDLSVSQEGVTEGDKVIVHATAVAGFNMKIKGAEYYVDSSDNTFAMSALDGSFDRQVEEITAEIDTSGLKPGTHLISVRAMELDNKWGVESSISFKVMESGSAVIEPEKVPYLTIVLIGAFIILLLVVLKLVIKKQ